MFVSPTLRELKEERRTVRAAIESLRLTPVMFELGARPHPPRDLYRSYLEQSDLFLGIHASGYGWVAPGMDISGLEGEYRLAEGLPRLVYVRRGGQSVDPRLESLLAHIAVDGVSYRSFAGAEELGDLVRDDLAVLLTERFEPSMAQRSRVEESSQGIPVRLVSVLFSLDEVDTPGDVVRSALSVLPISQERTVAVFSYTEDDANLARPPLDAVFGTVDRDQKLELSRLILDRTENFIISPAFVDEWDQEKMETITSMAHRSVLTTQQSPLLDTLMLFK